ncbi:MAG TPA: vWA domain-containing protein, partial [Bacillota bacterium]|nr:vWA domain-containing protein [Bacillota bacterium]
MRNAKGFSLIMIFLLLFQIAHSGLSFMAAAEGKQGIYQDSTKLLVENKSYDENSITWQVVINEAKQATEELSTTITFNNGQTHGSIEDSDDVDIEKTNQGYEITTPASQQTHKITLTTEITNNEQTEFNLLAETEFKDETIIAEETVEIVKEDSTAKEEFEQEAKTEEESTEEKSGDGEKDQATAEEPVKKDKGESNDNEHVNEDITDEVVEESHISFITPSVSTASPGVKSSSNWPSPGSLNLEKEEKSTSNFAEWEIELEVEGKDLQTSSDIVLVFDKSGSMNDRGRLPKAKQAAIDFTNIVLGEGSNARIALVEFSGEATMTQNFTGHQNKNILINRINSIRATGGTNIHAGLHQAKLLLNESDAEHKTIVLLSDGEPTYSLKAGGYEQPYSWPGNRYDFLLKDFDYSTRIGNGVVGNRPDYGWNRYRCGGIIFPRYCYDPHVNDHVIPTISEAKHIMDSGIDIFSVGLEVGNVQDAIYTLENSQNKGFYSGSEDDMEEIFEKIAASLTYAATEAVVTDPLGEMFDLVKDGSYNGENFEASHGIATWDESTETFEWDIGSIKEGETYTLKYKVTFDCEKDPEVNTKYPTNKETTMSYKDYTGSNATKNFPIPKVQIDEAQIKRVGYRVNVDGEPIDENGDVVSSWQDAKQFYDDIVTGLQPNQNHEIDAGDTPGGYVLHQDFTDPAIVNVANLVCNLALF